MRLLIKYPSPDLDPLYMVLEAPISATLIKHSSLIYHGKIRVFWILRVGNEIGRECQSQCFHVRAPLKHTQFHQ